MASSSSEQARHDRINLGRIVRRLDKSTGSDEWNDGVALELWIRAKAALQRVNYARKLLRNLEAEEFNPSASTTQYYNSLKEKLDRVEHFVQEIETRLAPKSTRMKPILPLIPVPPVEDTSGVPESGRSVQPLGKDEPSIPTDGLLLSPADDIPLPIIPIPMPTLIPQTQPSAPTKSTTTASASGVLLQNSQALHHELSDQLAQMATQLRRNAVHFSDTLAKDQDLVKETQEKLEGNYDVMKRERVRLRDHRGKSGSTTCLVVASIVGVLVVFFLMFLLIRLTRII